MKKWSWEVADRVAFAAIALAGAAFLTALAVFLIRAARGSPVEWAAWAQAIGMILAVLVAIYVPFKMRLTEMEADAKRRDEDRRVCLAMAKKSATYVNEFLRVAVQENLIGPTPSHKALFTAEMISQKIETALHVLRLSLNLHMLGDLAAARVLTVIENAQELKICIATIASKDASAGMKEAAISRFPLINRGFIDAWKKLEGVSSMEEGKS